jgi:hypothetical protein
MKKRRHTEKLSYKEGTWFAVPLRQGGYAVGRVARHTPEGEIILAYFFGPKRERVPTLDEIDRLEPHEAVKVIRIGGLGLIDGSWPIIGDSTRWERQRWPIPAFIRREDPSRTAWRVVYCDDDPNSVPTEERIPYETTGLESDRLSGHKAAEIRLSQLLEA